MPKKPAPHKRIPKGKKGYWGQVVAGNLRRLSEGQSWDQLVRGLEGDESPRGKSAINLYRWETGMTDPSLGIVIALARRLGVGVEDLLEEPDGTDVPFQSPRAQVPAADWIVFHQYRHAPEKTRRAIRDLLSAIAEPEKERAR